MMVLILCVLGIAHAAFAFAPNGLQKLLPSCCGKRCRPTGLILCDDRGRRDTRLRMSTAGDLTLDDTTGGVLVEDADGIGGIVKHETSDVLLGVTDGAAVLEEETVLQTLTNPGEDIAHEIVFAALSDNPQGTGLNLEEEKGVKAPSGTINSADAATAVMETSLSELDSNGILPSPNLLPDSVKEELMSVSLDNGKALDSESVAAESALDSPDMKKILKFAIPAIGVWLCSPILSLIDTSSVGLLSGTAQQAALNPAVAVTDYAALLAAFMYTATTNLVATAQEKEKNCDNGKPLTSKTLVTSLQLSGFVGAGLGTALIVLARFLLRTIIGNDSIDPEVFAAAMKYVRIRALGMPAAVVIGSAQSASLGMKDIKSPLYVLLAAAVVNFIGDMIFVGSSNPLLGGAAGAAWATVFSQYAALAMFLKWFVSKPGGAETQAVSSDDGNDAVPGTAKKINLTNTIMELTGKSQAGAPRRKSFRKSIRGLVSPNSSSVGVTSKKKVAFLFLRNKSSTGCEKKDSDKASPSSVSTRGFLHGRFRKRDLVKVPDKESAMEFWPYVIPVTTTSVGRVSSYVAMSHVVSSALGTISMAANQIILSLFYCLCPLADSLNLTAQSFVPAIFEKRRLRVGADSLKRTAANFLKAGGLFSAVMVGAVACIPIFSKFFTADPTVIAQVNVAVPFLAGTFAVHGAICAAEGLLLGQKDLGFLGKAYGIFFAAVPYFMLRVKKAALSGLHNVDLRSVWQVFMGYQLVRVSLWVLRVKQLESRTRRGVERVADL